jgi:ABC-2 type transport system ATP-binding protein
MPAAAPSARTVGGPGAASGSPAIECENLVVRYGPLTAVDGLSLRAMAGEVLALLGPNGAGKTSTVESLEGYRRPSAGTVRVLGLDPRADHRVLSRRTGVMLQGGGVYPMLGPRRVLRLFAAYYDEPEDPAALLELVALEEAAETPWRHLSGGQQQRLSLALALVGRPDVVFLDEPTAGVDPQGRIAIRDVITGLRNRGACVLLSTHEMGEAERLADRVVIIHRGRAAASGTQAELAASPAVSFGAPPGLDITDLATVLGAPVSEHSPGRYEVAAVSSPQLTAALASWLAARDAPLSDLRTGRSLEDTYLSIVGEAATETDSSANPGVERRGRSGRGRRTR